MQELNELKNLVIQSLEANGSLSNIRAQIRASVFKVIDQSDTPAAGPKKPSPFSWENPKCQSLLSSQYGLLCLQLIKEFFQFYAMDYSSSVFSSESNIREAVKREQLSSQLPLTQVDQNSSLLLQILEQLQQKQNQTHSDSNNLAVLTSTTAEGGQQVNNTKTAPKVTGQSQKETKTDEKLSNQEKDLENSNKSDAKPIEKSTANAVEDFKTKEIERQEKELLVEKKDNQVASNVAQTVETTGDGQQKKSQQEERIQKQELEEVDVAVGNKNMQGREVQGQFEHSAGEDHEENEDVEEQLDQYDDDDEEGVEDVDIDGDAYYAHKQRQQQFEEESEDFIGQSSKGQDISVDSEEIEQYDLIIGVDDF